MYTAIFARGYNISGQVELCREYAENKGYSVQCVIVGQGKTLPEIISGLNGDIERVIVRDMSRLSRNALENYTIQTELEIDYGVLIESVTGQAESTFMRSIIAAVHDEQRREKERCERIYDLKLRGIID